MWRFSEEGKASTRTKVLVYVTVQNRLFWGHLSSVWSPFICTRPFSCRSNQVWGAVEWMLFKELLCLPPLWNLYSLAGRVDFLPLASSKPFLVMLSLGYVIHTGSCTSIPHCLSALLCEKCVFCAIILYSPLLTKLAHKLGCLPDVLVLPSAKPSAPAVFDTGLTSLAKLNSFQSKLLLYEFRSHTLYEDRRCKTKQELFTYKETLGIHIKVIFVVQFS